LFGTLNKVIFAKYSGHFNDPSIYMAKLYTPIKIILADDHDVLRDGFHALLKKQNDIEIIGEAKNGQQLIDLTRRLQPDVIITDIMMPVKTGIDAIKEITAEFPAIGIIAFSMYNEEELILDMLKAGASGYILKSSGREEVIAAIKAVRNGQRYYCKETDGILKSFLTDGKNRKPKLTEKEKSIIRLICREFTSPEIARELGLSKRTVSGYREQIMEKIGAKNLVGIVMFAIRNKLFEFRK
jgi:DNA-binding NarL/FixJ family response regulator